MSAPQTSSIGVCVCEWDVREVSAPEFCRREPPPPQRNAVVFSLCSRSQLSDPIFSAAFKVQSAGRRASILKLSGEERFSQVLAGNGTRVLANARRFISENRS